MSAALAVVVSASSSMSVALATVTAFTSGNVFRIVTFAESMELPLSSPSFEEQVTYSSSPLSVSLAEKVFPVVP